MPDEFKKQNDKTKNSEVKSLANSKFDQGRTSSTNLDFSLKEKEGRLVTMIEYRVNWNLKSMNSKQGQETSSETMEKE